MCQTAIRVIAKSLQEVNDADLLVKIKMNIALFIETMEVCGSLHLVSEYSLTSIRVGDTPSP